jgi:hypothetical protein
MKNLPSIKPQATLMVLMATITAMDMVMDK